MQSESNISKKYYHKPQLSVYGDVKTYTLAFGTQSLNGDGAGNNGMDKTT